MKAKFIGDPNDDFSGPKVLRMSFGAFPFGVFVPVSDEIAEQLNGHSHFVVEKGTAPEYVAPEPPPPREDATEDAEAKAGGLTKAETIERLTALGAEFDARWGLPKLRSALETAEFAAGED